MTSGELAADTGANTDQGGESEGGLSQLVASRRAKLARLRSSGHEPFPGQVPARTHTTMEALRAFEAVEALESYEASEASDPSEISAPTQIPDDVRLNGRLVGAIRLMGGSAFVHLADGGGRLQLLLRRDGIGAEAYDSFVENVDAGDIVSVSGTMMRTRRGEATLAVESWRMLAKSILPLPEKWHGLQDKEARYRQRHLDLLSNPESRDRLLNRTRIVSSMRRFLDERGFLEVETPVLQPIYGGGSAEPFVTDYHALERRMYLRIADELYLKRLLIGGLEKVYEVGKDFRNEGIDRSHLPEFTQMECYWAFADYTDMMVLTEEMIAHLAREVVGSATITFDGHQIDLTPPWRRLSVRDGILASTGIDIDVATELGALRAALAEREVRLPEQPTWSKTVDKILQHRVEGELIAPTFLLDYPVELSPLAKKKAGSERYVERFEPFIGGLEVGNSFTELNDPIDQEERFSASASQRAAGDLEAHPIDTDFVEALMHGMPPAGGLGIGVDRIVMLLTNAATIRDAVLFPQLR